MLVSSANSFASLFDEVYNACSVYGTLVRTRIGSSGTLQLELSSPWHVRAAGRTTTLTASNSTNSSSLPKLTQSNPMLSTDNITTTSCYFAICCRWQRWWRDSGVSRVMATLFTYGVLFLTVFYTRLQIDDVLALLMPRAWNRTPMRMLMGVMVQL